MAEDFQPNYWWNNSASGSGFDRSNQPNTSPSSSSISCSTTITDAGGAAFSWPSTAGISESKPSILCDNQIDSSHTPGFGLISTLYTDWNQTLPEKAECSFHSMLHDHDRGTNPFSRQDLGESSSTIPFKDSNFSSSSSSSSMLQGLIQPGCSRFQLPCLDNEDKNHDYQSQSMALHGVSNETQQLSWKPFADTYTPFWNASVAGFYPSPLSPSITQLSASKSGCSTKTNTSLGGDWAKRGNREPEQKKTRIGTPLPMPDITVMRKEKLRDRVTALQQLVSPFGKTDTASVLQEAIEYIKFLHDQVSVLCAPYFKTGRPMQQNQNSENKSVKAKDGEDRPDVLRSRGLCLVPMESIYSADDNITAASEFWTPIHGRTFW